MQKSELRTIDQIAYLENAVRSYGKARIKHATAKLVRVMMDDPNKVDDAVRELTYEGDMYRQVMKSIEY